MILATHNSATCYKLVWWQRILSPILNLFSRCQNKSIVEQLALGVRVFNLQVTYYKKDWYISHGLAIYDKKLKDVLKDLLPFKDVYIQLALDKNFILGQNKEKFKELVDTLDTKKFIYIWIEGDKFLYSRPIDMEEKYWTFKGKSKSFIDKLPLLKYQAKKNNKTYKSSCNSKYLMLDYVQY